MCAGRGPGRGDTVRGSCDLEQGPLLGVTPGDQPAGQGGSERGGRSASTVGPPVSAGSSGGCVGSPCTCTWFRKLPSLRPVVRRAGACVPGRRWTGDSDGGSAWGALGQRAERWVCCLSFGEPGAHVCSSVCTGSGSALSRSGHFSKAPGSLSEGTRLVAAQRARQLAGHVSGGPCAVLSAGGPAPRPQSRPLSRDLLSMLLLQRWLGGVTFSSRLKGRR